MNTLTDLSVPHALTGAALTLSWCGWCQEDFETPDGRVCAEGALWFAITGYTRPRIGQPTGDESSLFVECRRYLKLAADTDWLAQWNDGRGRTAEQVLAVFAQARRLAGAS